MNRAYQLSMAAVFAALAICSALAIPILWSLADRDPTPTHPMETHP